MLRTFVRNPLIAISIICFSLIAPIKLALADTCSEFSEDVALDFENEFIGFQNDYREDVAKLKNKLVNQRKIYSEEDFERLIALNRDELDIDRSVIPMSKQYPAAIRNIPNSEQDRYICDQRNQFERQVAEKLRLIEALFEKVVSNVEESSKLYDLEDDEGLVLITAYASGYARAITIVGESTFGEKKEIGPLNNSQYVQLIKLPKDSYRFERIKVGDGYYNFEDNDFIFTVEPGVINLSGVFLYENINGSG